MVYEQFLEAVRWELEQRVEPDCRVRLVQIPKNNGVLLDSVTFTRPSSRFSPTVYLNALYDSYLSGTPIRRIAEVLLEASGQNSPLSEDRCGRLLDFSQASRLLAFRLVNTGANRTALAAMPHREFLDLSLVYYLLLDDSPDCQMTSAVTSQCAESWGVDEEEIYRAAAANTPSLLPHRLDSMTSVMERITGKPAREHGPDGFPHDDLFVLTNCRGLNGAACMLYPGILKDFASRAGKDLVIFPSSIHEVLLLPLNDAGNYQEMNRMVAAVNSAEVPVEDRLADHIYLFSLKSGRISIPGNVQGSGITAPVLNL